jgi:hypothetical protein
VNVRDHFDFNLSEEDGVLTISGGMFIAPDGEDSHWTIQPIDENRFMVVTREAASRMAKLQTGIARCNIDVFADFINGLTLRQWSGCVNIDTGVGIKRLYFSDGNLSFAASNLIDHRLGEVIYRYGFISLDELAENTVKVTRTHKFGQVLLSGGLFSTVDLWEALKTQVLEIVRCVFLFPSVYFEIEPGKGLAPTEVVFAEGTKNIVQDAFSFGCMFREFLSRIQPDSSIKIHANKIMGPEFNEGSFYGDLISLIKENARIESVIKGSKLLDINTYVAIMNLVNRGLCELDHIKAENHLPNEHAASVKSVIDAFTVLIRQVKIAFQNNGVDFPLEDLRQFCIRLNPSGFVSLYLNEHGEVHRESILNMYSQCENTPGRAHYFVTQIESIIQFSMQVTGDLLPYEVAKSVKSKFKEMRA